MVWRVIFFIPGEMEIPLLALCVQRDDVDVIGVLDPHGAAAAVCFRRLASLDS